MRVALDVTPLLGARTGIGQTVEGLLGALPAAAPEVEVVPWVLSARAAGGALPVGARRLPLPASLAIRAWGAAGVPRADRWLGDADVVHGTNFVVPPMRRRPTTVTVHDCWCARYPERCRPDAAAFTAAVRRAVRRGAWVHVSTEFVAAEVRDVYRTGERVAVVPFGVPAVERPGGGGHPGTGPGAAPFVLALGALDARKGLDGLVRAFGMLAPGHDGLRLVVAGPPGDAADAVARAVDHLAPAARARVDVLGPVDDATRRRLLHDAAALAYPSRYEGFGFPVLEAMAAGTPVVAAAAGAVPEVAGGAAELVPVGDDGALAAALDRVVGTPAVAARLVAAGRERAASFSWARTARGMADLWQRAAGERS